MRFLAPPHIIQRSATRSLDDIPSNSQAQMLAELHLKNFRGFGDHTIRFRKISIVVGQNNAGKSTIVEALRLISIVCNRYDRLNYKEPPERLNLPKLYSGATPDLRNMEINFKSLCHQYGVPPAILTATFDTKEKMRIYLYPEPDAYVFAVLFDRNDKVINSKAKALKLNLPQVSALPQVAPLAREETILSPDYLRGALSSSLAPHHFRNQLNLLYDHFPNFKRLSEESWPGLRIRELAGRYRYLGESLALIVQDREFSAEVGWMGHGLQIWLQIMWFFARVAGDETVILDEPDVYLHADLQRKLIRLVKQRQKQVIIATHSIEIMSEVSPDEIIIADKRKRRSDFASSLPAVQKVIDQLGAMHNIQLARLWNSKKVLMVEGDDIRLLKIFHNKLCPESQEPIDTIPDLSIGGWDGWHYAVGSSMFLRNAGGASIVCYCILDRDYHPDEKIEKRRAEAAQRGVELHIWSSVPSRMFLT